MELNRNNMRKLMLLIAFGIALYLGLQNMYRISELLGWIGSFFAPIVLGLAVAFVLNVLMRQVETRLFAPLNRRFTKKWRKLRRPLSLLLSILIILGLIALILLILIPELVNTITSLTNNIPDFFNRLQTDIAELAAKHPKFREYVSGVNIDWSNVSQVLATYGQRFAGSLVNSTVAATAGFFHGMMTFVLGFVIALNVLLQKETLQRQAKRVLYAYAPEKPANRFAYLCSLTNRAFSNFIAGTCTEACILGTLCFIGMSIFRFPYALLISVIVAFMALIPILGAFLSNVIGALLILTVSPLQAVWFVIYFTVLQQLEGNLIFPHVVGSKVGLPVLWVLAAVAIGGSAFGVAGMLISIPLFSVLYTLLKEDVGRRMKKKEQPDNESDQNRMD